jgi:hypothetical protein
MLQIEFEKKKFNRILRETDNRNRWRRWEDILVATVFGFAAYLPFDQLLGPILKAATPLRASRPFPSGIEQEKIKDVLLWPEMGNIRELDRSLLTSDKGNDRQEPDAFWNFQDFSLVVEAKRLEAKFSLEQLYGYIGAFEASETRPLWFLAVGKGQTASKSLKDIRIPLNTNVLYIDWKTILAAILKKIPESTEAYFKCCLQDISKSLKHRNLDPYEGFHIRNKEFHLLAGSNIEKAVQGEWFPHDFSLWPVIPKNLLLTESISLNSISDIYT